MTTKNSDFVTKAELKVELQEMEQRIDARFDAIDARIDAIDRRLDGQEAWFQTLDKKLDEIKALGVIGI